MGKDNVIAFKQQGEFNDECQPPRLLTPLIANLIDPPTIYFFMRRGARTI